MARMLARTWGFWILVGALAGCGSALPAPGSDHVRTTAGGYVLADPPPGMIVSLGSKPLLNEADAAAASGSGAAKVARPPTPY